MFLSCFCSVDIHWHHYKYPGVIAGVGITSPKASLNGVSPNSISFCPGKALQSGWHQAASLCWSMDAATICLLHFDISHRFHEHLGSDSVCRGFLAANDWVSMVVISLWKNCGNAGFLWTVRCFCHVFHIAPGSLPRHDIRVVHYPSVSAHVYTAYSCLCICPKSIQNCSRTT